MVSKEEEDRAAKLTLEVVESPSFDAGTSFLITAKGYTESKRKGQDGCVYLGAVEQGVVDIVFPQSAAVNSVIQFQRAAGAYFVKDNGQGLGTFLKIEEPLELKAGHVLAFGETSMAVMMVMGSEIQLRFLDGPRADKSL